jgi:hypothetical protein
MRWITSAPQWTLSIRGPCESHRLLGTLFSRQGRLLDQLRIAGLDNIGEALAIAEGEAYK